MKIRKYKANQKEIIFKYWYNYAIDKAKQRDLNRQTVLFYKSNIERKCIKIIINRIKNNKEIQRKFIIILNNNNKLLLKIYLNNLRKYDKFNKLLRYKLHIIQNNHIKNTELFFFLKIKRQYLIKRYKRDKLKNYFSIFRSNMIFFISNKKKIIDDFHKSLLVYCRNLSLKALRGYKNLHSMKKIREKYEEGSKIFITKKHFEKWMKVYNDIKKQILN